MASRRSLLLCCCSLAVLLAIAVRSAGAQAYRPFAGSGSFCDHFTKCTAPHSLCINRTCSCANGYEINGTTCTIKLNSRCNSTNLCNRPGAHCINNVCVCSLNYVLSTNYQNCVPVATKLNQVCEVPAQCREFINSTCTAGICQCIPGHSYNASQKSCQVSGAEFSPHGGTEPWSDSPLAPKFVVPQRGDNVQQAGIIPQPTQPLQQRNTASASQHALGDKCSNDSMCNRTLAYSVCAGGKCGCAGGYEASGAICVMKLNSRCNTSNPCNRDGGLCLNNVCSCNTNTHVISLNRTTCLKKATGPYQPCTESAQCYSVAYAECYGGACVCINNYFLQNGVCTARGCQAGSCAYMGYAQCNSNGFCVCMMPGGLQGSDRCYRQVGSLGGKCNETPYDMCYLNADGVDQHVYCISGKCECIKPYKPNKQKTRCVSGAASTVATFGFVLLAVVASLRA